MQKLRSLARELLFSCSKFRCTCILKFHRLMVDGMATALGSSDVNKRIKQLRDLVVVLDRIDRNQGVVDAAAYQAAAKTAFSLTYEEMGLLPMSDFAGPANALQNMAENIHFAVNGCFADLDGTGSAPHALAEGAALLLRMRAGSRAQEIGDSLLARVGSVAERLQPVPASGRVVVAATLVG